MTSFRSLTKLALCAVFALGFLCAAQAQDKKADPAGTWSWTRPGRNGGPDQKMTLKLKVEGDKVTGKVTAPGRQGGDPVETEIKDGKIKGDECPRNFNRLTLSWYLNEPRKGEQANVRCDPLTYDFFAARRIVPGEELTVDYPSYGDLPAKLLS